MAESEATQPTLGPRTHSLGARALMSGPTSERVPGGMAITLPSARPKRGAPQPKAPLSLLDFPVGMEVRVPRTNMATPFTWCEVVAHREGQLMVRVTDRGEDEPEIQRVSLRAIEKSSGSAPSVREKQASEKGSQGPLTDTVVSEASESPLGIQPGDPPISEHDLREPGAASR